MMTMGGFISRVTDENSFFKEEQDKQTGNGDGSYRSIRFVIIKKILRIGQESYRGSLIIR